MKTKLLKKVRKRWSIIYYSKYDFWGDSFKARLFVLINNKTSEILKMCQIFPSEDEDLVCESRFYSEKECINYLKNELIKDLRYRCGKQRKYPKIKVWYVNK